MSLQPSTLLLAALTFCATAWGQPNQGVRLASSPLGSHAGRVEVKYNGRWGTICDQGWNSLDGTVICNMLNFPGHICAVRSQTAVFGQGSAADRVWLTNLRCGFGDDTLNDCGNNRPQNRNPCSHSRDAAVICQDPSVMPVPYNITQTNQTTRTISISWMLPYIPPYIRAIDFRLSVSTLYRRTYHVAVTESLKTFDYTILGLSVNQTYEVEIAAEGEYQWCSYNEIIGNKSEPVNISTAAKAPPSTLPIRLNAADTNTPYIGRLQVFHNGEWGSVCNDIFGMEEANLACNGLNYTEGAVCYATSTLFPPSRGPIWLDNVDCSFADRFEDCSHNGWGVHNCRSSEAIGLVCNPGPSGLPLVTGFRVTRVSHTSISLEWDSALDSANGRYVIQHNRYGYLSVSYVSYPSTKYTLQRLQLGVNYTISIRAGISFRRFRGGNCYSRYLYGEYTEPITVETQENAPDVSVTNFHITILNSTAVEAIWRLPRSTIGINGVVRGFRIYVDKVNGSRRVITVEGDMIQAYIITDVESSAQYYFSMLIYTVADGPRSILLLVTMPDSDFIPLIGQFGVYGNGLEVVTSNTYTRGFNVLCGSHVQATTLFWKFSNGSRIGISNPGFREGVFENGTAVLQIGTAQLFVRRLTVCDGGVYTCVATSPEGGVHTRNFSLKVGSSPPSLTQPKLIAKGSTWVQIGWEPLDCDGGFKIISYDVQYKLGRYSSYSYTDAARVTSLNYTVHDLSPSTEYDFRVGPVSSVTSRYRFSRVISVTTHLSGPSPPRDVVTTLSYNYEVCARWRPPAMPAGGVALYKLYAEVVATSVDITDAIDLPTSTVVKSFPGNLRYGCMQLSQTDVIYHFQMSAVSEVQGELLEGTLSSITSSTTVYVPKPGIPQPIRLVGSPTNASVTLQWELPAYSRLSDIIFNVSYSGVVEWTSNEGVFFAFQEKGQETAYNTSLTFSPLTPSTKYTFKVAIITPQGQGKEVSVDVTTSMEVGDKLAYFQLRIQITGDCEQWHNDEPEQKLSQIRQSLMATLTSQCNCNVTTSHISQGEFSCRTGPTDTVTYRARVSGTSSRSASDMVELIRSWAQGGDASIKVGASRFQLDPTCDATLDNIHAPDCGTKTEVTPEGTTQDTKGTEQVTQKIVNGNDDSGNEEGSSSAQVVGILVGGIIAGLLLALLIALTVMTVLWTRKQKSVKDQSEFRELVNEPSSAHNSEVDEKTDKL